VTLATQRLDHRTLGMGNWGVRSGRAIHARELPRRGNLAQVTFRTFSLSTFGHVRGAFLWLFI
jgi:hypothetical protein